MIVTDIDQLNFDPAEYLTPSIQEITPKKQVIKNDLEILKQRDLFLDTFGIYGKGQVYYAVDQSTALLFIIYSQLFSRYFSYKGVVKLISQRKAAASDIHFVSLSTVQASTLKALKFLNKNFGIPLTIVQVDAQGQIDKAKFLDIFKPKDKRFFVYLDLWHPILGILNVKDVLEQLGELTNVTAVVGIGPFTPAMLGLKNIRADFMLADFKTSEGAFTRFLVLSLKGARKTLGIFAPPVKHLDFYWLNLFAKYIKVHSNLSGEFDCAAYKKLNTFMLEHESIAMLGANLGLGRQDSLVFTINEVHPDDVYRFFYDNGIIIGKDTEVYKPLYRVLGIAGVNQIAVSPKVGCAKYDELLKVFKDLMLKYGLI